MWTFAKEFGYEIKLLGIAKKVGEGVELRVHATMIPTRVYDSKSRWCDECCDCCG